MKRLFYVLLFLFSANIVFMQEIENYARFIGDWKSLDGKYFAKIYLLKNIELKLDIVTDLISKEKPVAELQYENNEGTRVIFSGNGWTAKTENEDLFVSNGQQSIQMKRFLRTSPTLNAIPPQNAVVLFDGSNTNAWTKVLEKDWLVGGQPVDNFTILPEGILQVNGHEAGKYESIITRQKFGDVKLHLEFRLLGHETNGGVYLMSRYEVNIKDAYGQSSPIAMGNISESIPANTEPSVNVAFPPMQWQTLDIDFRAPRFAKDGRTKIENARITLVHNGVTIYKNLELVKVKGATRLLGEAGVGPIYLQEHGSAYQFRNIWLIDNTVKGTEDYKTESKEKEGIEGKATERKGGNKNRGKNITKTNVSENKSNPLTEKDSSEKKKGKSIESGYDKEMNPAYKGVTIDLNPQAQIKSKVTSGFQHPGILVNRNQLVEIKNRVASGFEPQKSAFDSMLKSQLAQKDYSPDPFEIVSCGPRSNPDIGCKAEQRDCAAAYTQALLWAITGEKIYAENAIKIMNAWSSTFKQGHNYANGPVQAAWCGSVWPRAAEIIRYTSEEWSDADILAFQNMLRTQYLPSIIHGDCENGNKELAMCEALINIGVFCDDRDVFDLGVKMWRGRVPAYIYLKTDGPVPVEPSGCGQAIWSNKGLTPDLVDGLMQETARDSHHPTMAFASMINAAETAFFQGVNLYQEQSDRILAAIEFEAKHVKPNNIQPPPNLTFALNATFEIAFNHYSNRLGLNLPYMAAALPLARPAEGNHHVLWETLTHGGIGAIGTSNMKEK